MWLYDLLKSACERAGVSPDVLQDLQVNERSACKQDASMQRATKAEVKVQELEGPFFLVAWFG